MAKRIALLVLVLLATFSSGAYAVPRGASMLGLQFGNGTADLYDPTGTPGFYIGAYDHSEVRGRVEYWRMMSDDYAFTLAGGIGFFSEENEPGNALLPGAPTAKYSQSSFHVRIGGDRVVDVGERAAFFFGPGIEYWSGKSKFDDGVDEIESENVTRISLGGRVGGIMKLGSGFGLAGSIGHQIGRASAEEEGAKATWWPSSFEGSGGLLFTFGGN